MFLWIALISSAGFALESALSASLYRRLPVMVMSSLRGVSFSISMLPLLLWAWPVLVELQLTTVAILLCGSAFTITGNFCYGRSLRDLPLGVATAVGCSAMNVTVLLCSSLHLNEHLTVVQLGAFGLLIVSDIFLSIGKDEHQKRQMVSRFGIFLVVLYGVFGGLGNYCMSLGARSTHPFVAGYIWDVGAGFIGVGIALLKGRNPFTEITRRDHMLILLYCSPAAIGVAAFAYAMSVGPIGIASVLITSGVLFGSTLLARIWYSERLNAYQIIGMIGVCAAVCALKL